MSSIPNFFAQPESEVAKIFLAVDWKKTSLGAIATWSDLLKTLVKNLMRTPVPMVLWWGPDYVQIYNEAYIPIISLWGKGEAMGRPAKETWSDIWEDFTYPDIERVLTQDQGFMYENRLIPMSYKGQLQDTYWHYSYAPQFDLNGKTTGILITAQDNTRGVVAEKNLELAHKEAEERRLELYNFFMQSPTALVLFMGPDHIISLVSPMYQSIIGHHRRVIGQSAREAFTPRERDEGAIVRNLDSVFQTGIPHFAEEVPVTILEADGNEKNLRIDLGYHPLRNSENKILGVMGNIQDVTRRVEARLRAETNENLLRVITERLPAFVSYMDTSRRYQFVNRAYTNWFGLKREEIEGKTRKELFTDGGLYETMRPEEEKAFQGESVSFELNLSKPTGEHRILDAEYLPDFDPQTHEVRGIIGVAHDITQRKKDLAELALAKEAAENANATKSAFLANMSHEIRTPLGAILGFSELLKDSSLSEEEKGRYIETISRNGKALTRIIDDILDLAKVEAGRLEVEELDFSLVLLAHEVIELFTGKAKEKGIFLQLDCEDTLPEFIRSDPTRVRQVLINIIGNAIKFTDQGGVTVRMKSSTAREGACRIQIAVEDSGPGLTQEQRERLFKPFTQADNTTTRQFGGTGLGLALSRRLSEALGGNVSILDNQQGKGCTFVITFLAIKSDRSKIRDRVPLRESPSKTLSKPRQRELEAKSILVVDDSPDNQFLVSRILTKNGAHVATASDGLEAVNMVENHSYEAVLMDIQMPRMDGYEALKQLRAKGLKIPIIALTAHAMKEERTKTREAGFDDHLTKPIDSKELIGSLKRLLDLQ